MTPTRNTAKSGAALVIALGFLAVLTVLVVAFSALTRSDRLAARSYLNSAQTRHLLHTALSRALLDIDAAASTNYPAFYALGSIGDSTNRLAETLDFSVGEYFFQHSTDGLMQQYITERSRAKWETVSARDGTETAAVGRIGYIIINSSGFLDANAVGGAARRGRGRSPAEIRLSPDLLPELQEGGVRIDSFGNYTTATNSADAFAFNRANTWHGFESLRDVRMLNNESRGGIISGPIKSFSTFSHSAATNDSGRSYMGTNETSVLENIDVIEARLGEIADVEPEFVIQQLLDYLDTDTVPQDLDDEYSDYSVEPVPLINELSLNFSFSFYPEIETIEYDDGGVTSTVTSVTVSNRYELAAETWYPFVGWTNEQLFTFSIDETPIRSSVSTNADLIASVSDWETDEEIPAGECHPDNREYPYEITLSSNTTDAAVNTADALVELFESLQSSIQFPLITITDAAGDKVDQVLDLEFPMTSAVLDSLMPEIENLATNLFNASTAENTSKEFTVSMACIDPRLNWDGTSLEQWQENYGLGGDIDSIGEVNGAELALIETDDAQDMLYVRNQNRIDSPWEFTYLLPNTSSPWKTFQMLAAYDTAGTRTILDKLSPYPDGPPRRGRVSPFSPHTNVVASVFQGMPINEFMGADERTRLDADGARNAAALFIEQIKNHGWTAASKASAGISTEKLKTLMGAETNPWILESFFRSSRELFNPDDTLYTILIAAQAAADTDGDGTISNREVRATQQAAAYVWRDRTTGRAAVVFFGLDDTLRSTIAGGESWGDILQAFEP